MLQLRIKSNIDANKRGNNKRYIDMMLAYHWPASITYNLEMIETSTFFIGIPDIY